MRQIIAMGGGGFSMEPENPLLDQYILKQVKKEQPKVCFIPTASGDQDNYVKRFYHSFENFNCNASHLSLFEPNFNNLEEYVMTQDILYIGGGNTRNMLVLWKEWGLDLILRKAYENGIILAGLSAGSICWFEEGLTDPLNAPLYKLNCLGFLKGSNCPHYDGEGKRKPAYHELIATGVMKSGYAVEDGVALHFIDEVLKGAVSSQLNGHAYKVEKENTEVNEKNILVTYLG
ncbi:peptidase E [Bacillus sp. N3536]|nr:peptidase E [Bacillus sp. N3536]